MKLAGSPQEFASCHSWEGVPEPSHGLKSLHGTGSRSASAPPQGLSRSRREMPAIPQGETLPVAQMRRLTRQANSLMVKVVYFLPFSSLFLYKITETNKFSQVLLSHRSSWVQEDGQEAEMSKSFKRHGEHHRHPDTELQSPSSLPQKNWEVPSRSRSPALLTLGNR